MSQQETANTFLERSMTPYATELLAYTQSQLPKGADAAAWLDSNINPLWRQLCKQPKAKEIISIGADEDEHQGKDI